jgi:hypothetical protein
MSPIGVSEAIFGLSAGKNRWSKKYPPALPGDIYPLTLKKPLVRFAVA